MNIKIISALFAILLVAGIVFFTLGSNVLRQKPPETATSEHFRFSVNHPTTWRQSEDENLFYLINTKSKAKNFRTYITITNINPFGQDTPLETFDKIYQAEQNSDVSDKFKKSDLTKSTETKIKNTEIEGQKAVELFQDTQMPGPIYSTNIYILKGGEVWLIREIASSKEDLQKDLESFNSIISTFKFAD